MIPILFSADETAFTSHGLGELVDAISCYVTHEINGEYELLMTYPMSGIHYDGIANRTVILAKTNPVEDPEPFRVYRMTKPLNGIVTVYARHIVYDMSGIVKGPVAAISMQAALAALSTAPFELTTARSVATPFVTKTPRNLWKLIGGEEGSLLSVYRGEWIFSKFTAENVTRMGADHGVTVIYGKNLLDMTQEEEIDAMYSAVHPFWYNAEADLLVDGGEVEAGSIGYDRVFLYDCSDRWQEAPTVAQLQTAAQAYINDHDMTIPKVSLSLNWQMLADCVEYAGQETLDRVSLGDTVHVIFDRLGVNATARVRKIKWNVLLDRYDRVDIGSVKQNLAEIIAAQEKQVENKPTATAVNNAVERATRRITGANGGYVVQHFNANGEPTETLWMDTDDEATAVNVIRANYQGIGLSTHGVNGPFTIAITAEGIVANAITTGVINAALITAGTMSADRVNLTGAVGLEDLSEDAKSELVGGVTTLYRAEPSAVPIPDAPTEPVTDAATEADDAFVDRVSGDYRKVEVSAIKGRTVMWNQLVASYHVQQTLAAYDMTYLRDIQYDAGHVYLITQSGLPADLYAQTEDVAGIAQVYGSDVGAIGTASDSAFGGPLIANPTDTAVTLDCYINIHDLTLMYGAGNEPTTVAAFRADWPLPYYDYCEAKLISYNGGGIKTAGRNLFDSAKLVDMGFARQSDGIYYVDRASRVYNQVLWENRVGYTGVVYVRAKRKSPQQVGVVIVNNYTDGTFDYITGSASDDFVEIVQDSDPSKTVETISFSYAYNVPTYLMDVCISLSDGEYEPHWDWAMPTPISDIADHHDGWKAVDMGTLSWSHVGSDIFVAALPNAKLYDTYTQPEAWCHRYRPSSWANFPDGTFNLFNAYAQGVNVKDSSFGGNVTAFTAAMQGEILYYATTDETGEADVPFFPDGLQGAGDAYDELTPTQAVRRIGWVDLGTLDWTYSTGANSRFTATVAGLKLATDYNTKSNIVCTRYVNDTPNAVYGHVADGTICGHPVVSVVWVYDSNFTSATAFKAAMRGTMMCFEMAEPVTMALSQPLELAYRAELGGTESVTPANATTPYTAPVRTQARYYQTDGLGYGDWSTTAPAYRPDYPYYFTTAQAVYSDGSARWGDVVSNEGLNIKKELASSTDTTVIDGGHITTGYITGGSGVYSLNLDTGECIMRNGHFSGNITGSSVETSPITDTGINYKIRVEDDEIIFLAKSTGDWFDCCRVSARNIGHIVNTLTFRGGDQSLQAVYHFESPDGEGRVAIRPPADGLPGRVTITDGQNSYRLAREPVIISELGEGYISTGSYVCVEGLSVEIPEKSVYSLDAIAWYEDSDPLAVALSTSDTVLTQGKMQAEGTSMSQPARVRAHMSGMTGIGETITLYVWAKYRGSGGPTKVGASLSGYYIVRE